MGELIDAERLRARGFASDAIAGACAISGLYDLEPVRLIAMNEQIRLTRDEVKQFSPLRREYTPSCPVIATVGGDETEEFLDQTREYAQLCTRAGAVVEHREEQGRDHITVVLDALGAPGHRLNRAVLRMMGVV